jgi:hypothetical protein
MIDTLTRAAKLAPLLAAGTLFATAALAQAPSQAQRDAIKSQCRSDYMAHCSSVPPGGEASLECLQKNMSSLSSGCQGAVRAVEAPAAPAAAKPAEAAPAKPAAPAAATTAPAVATTTAAKSAEPKAAAGAPTKAQISAIRTACRSDYPKVCKGVPAGGAPALQCLEKNKAKLSAACGNAVAAASGGTAAPAAGAAAPADAAARRTVRAAVGLRHRRPLDLRRRGARRRPHRAMPRDQRRAAFARMQGRAGAVRRAVNRAVILRGRPG